jgi:hypothetical protein
MSNFKPDPEVLPALGLLLENAIINSEVTEKAISLISDSLTKEDLVELVNAEPEEE